MIEFHFLGLFEGIIFTDLRAFLSLWILLGCLIGGGSGYLTNGVFGGFLVFSYIVTRADVSFYENSAIAIIVVFLLFLVFRLISYSLSSRQGASS